MSFEGFFSKKGFGSPIAIPKSKSTRIVFGLYLFIASFIKKYVVEIFCAEVPRQKQFLFSSFDKNCVFTTCDT